MSVASSCLIRANAVALSTLLAAGLVMARDASAQARPALTRDTDNADLAPFVFSGTIALNTLGNNTITTVPSGKRLVIDQVSYSFATLTSGDSLNQAYLYASTSGGAVQVRQYFPINPPHAYTSVTGSTAQDASFAGRTYFEAGEVVKFLGGTVSSDASRTIGLTITGHFVTP